MWEMLKHVGALILSTLALFFLAALVSVATDSSAIQNVALLVAFLSALSFWLVFALDYQKNYSRPTQTQPQEKAKRGVDSEDAKLALLLSMLSAEERANLKTRLIDDLTADGEALTLAELLAAQEQENAQQQHTEH